MPISLVVSALEHVTLASRNLNTEPRPHIAMSYSPLIAWKTPLTHTPPPICTSAPGS